MSQLSIRAELTKDGHTTVLNVPCNDYGIDIALQNLGEIDMTKTEQLCSRLGGDIPELAILTDQFIDIAALNFLAKRLDSFDDREMNQFKAAVIATNAVGLKDMINLTFNLHNYTLITDFSDTAKIGRMHRMNVEGAIPIEADDGYNYRALGESVIASDKKTVTPYGVLVENGLPVREVYNGKTFPEYLYEECVFEVTIGYGNRLEYLYLPCAQSAIDRAVHRIDAVNIADCSLEDIEEDRFTQDFLREIQPDFSIADIGSLNILSSALVDIEASNMKKLIAVCDYAEVQDFEKAALIAKNIDSFEFAPDIRSTEGFGEYLIRDSGYYAYDEELNDYYDYESLGIDTMQNQYGDFTSYGYVGIRDDITLEEIIGENENEEMTMGGM